MHQKPAVMKDPVIRFTTIALVITIAWTLIEHFLGYNTIHHEVGQYTRMLTAIFFYVCVALAVWVKRKQQANQLIFKQGFKTGALVSLYYSIGVTIWFALYAEVINKDYQPTLLAFTRKELEAKHLPPEVIAAKLKEVEMSSGGSVVSYLLLFVFMALFGLIVAVIASAIMKKKGSN
jgi:hypothetical protein